MKKIKIKGYYLGAAVFFSIALFMMNKLEYCGSVWGDMNSNFIDTSLNITDLFFLIVPFLLYVLLILIDEFMNKYKINPTEYSKKTKSKLMIIWSIIIFIVWTCYFLTYYPGGIYSDTFSAIDMVINGNILQNHHPILYTWLIKLALKFGMDIMGKDMTWSLGLFLLMQMILMGITVIAFLNWSLNKKLPKLFINLSMVYLVFFPLIPLYGISVWKDTPFCIAFFYYALCIVDLFYEDKNIKYGIILFVTSLLVAFTRNNGIYIIAGTNIILAIYGFAKKRNRYICILGVIVVLICGIVQGPIYNAIGVKQTEFVENLGIPIQQIGYTVASDGTISDEEKEEISKFIPYDALKDSYVPCLVDSIKWRGGFNNDYLEENKMQFFNLWFRLLKQNPGKYVYAYMIGTCGYWALNASGFDAYVQNYVWSNSYGVEHIDLFQKYIGFSLYDSLNPERALSSAIFFWILFFCIVICIQRNSLRYIIPFLPPLLIWLTIMVATPIAVSMRYAFGLVFLLPIFFATLAIAERKNEDDFKRGEDDFKREDRMKFLMDKKNLYFTGMYLSLFAFMVCSAAGWGVGVALFKILEILCFGLFLFKENSKYNAADFEKSVMVLVVLLFNIFMLQRGKMQGEYETLNLFLSCAVIVMGIAYFVFHYFASSHDESLIKKWVTKNIIILLIIMCFVLLSVEVINHWFMWDAWDYYVSLLNVFQNFDADFSGIYGLYLCDHASIGYSLWLILFQLFKEGTVSVQIADIVLAGVSIFAYYQILRKMLGKSYTDKALALATAPYAFSPFVMGLVGNMSLDSATMYFAVIFIACSLYRYECLELIFAFLFCFTKEPAVIYYVVYIIVKIICEYFSENRFHLWKLLKFGFGNIKNYLYALPVVIWMILYKLRQSSGTGGWGSASSNAWDSEGWNCFGIRQDFILAKLKQIFYLNFNWLIFTSIIVGIIVLCVRKLKTKGEYGRLVPIGAMGVSVIVFNCVYITFMLPRYIVLIAPVIYLIVAVVIGNIKNKLFLAWNILLSVLVIMQCFYSIDPIMGKVFPLLQIGDKKYQVLYETGDQQRFVDNITYNRQKMYWSDTIVKVLKESGYNGDMLIVRDDSLYNVLGHWWILWDTQKEKLEYYNKKDVPRNCVWVETCTVAETENKFESVKGNRILYIIPEWREINEGFISENERFTKEIIKQGEVNNKGFHIQYVVMDMKYKAPLGKGNYIISPKQNSSLGLGTDGQWIWLKEEGDEIAVTYEKSRYKFNFNDYYVAMDVRYNYVDENGTVWTYEENDSNAQKFRLEKVEDYYMICWEDYALTYNLDDNSVRLTPITGDENQLWLFSR